MREPSAEVIINIDNIRNNIIYLKSLLNPNTNFMAILKANAYGHGLNKIAKEIDDIVDGIYKVVNKVPRLNQKKKFKFDSMSKVAPFRILNIGNTKKIYLLDFINTLEKVLNKKVKRNYLPMQKGDVLSTLSDSSLLKRITGYNPKTNYIIGIRKFINWYVNFYN